MSFNPCIHWNGHSERLSKNRSYHKTISVSDEPERELTANLQDRNVYDAVRFLGTVGATAVHAHFQGAMLKSSVRRSLNTLMRCGKIRKAGTTPGPHGHPETTWTAA